MKALTPGDPREPFIPASSPEFKFIICTPHCALLSSVSDTLTKMKGHCQPGQKQAGSECVCLSPEEDCK